METPMQQAMRAVSDALNYDGLHKSREAYVKYLQCLQIIVHNLLRDIYQQVTLEPGMPQKLVKLGQQCLDRVGNLVDEIDQPSDTGQSSHGHPPISPMSPMTPLIPVTPSLPTFQAIGTDDNPDAGVKRRPKTLTPLEMAQRQNQQMMAAYKARLARLQKNKPGYTNLNLTLHRKLAENMAIAKAREEALAKKMKERQKRLEDQAASRFVASPGMSKDELERRQLYTEILEYEHDAKWPMSYREQLKTNRDDPKLMQDLVKCILMYGDHPLTKMIAIIQTQVYKKLEPLCNEFIGDLDHVKVPYESSKDKVSTPDQSCDDKPLQKRATPVSGAESSSEGGSSEYKDFTEVVEDNKENIDQALEANEQVVKRLSLEQDRVEDVLQNVENVGDQESQVADGPCLSRMPEEDLVELKMKHLQQEALERHLQYIVKDIHEALDRVLTMFVVAYEALDCPTGRDVTYVNIEEPFFKPIWPFLISLYRFVNRKTEETLAEIMTKGRTLSAEDMDIKIKFLPSSSQHPYPFAPAVTELCKMTMLVCPLSKLECIVRMVRTICQCVLEYDQTGSVEGLPNMGADDLLPILMLVIIRSGLPQLVSECHVMEEFVHEGCT